MGKTSDKLRQGKHREKLKKDDKAYESYLKKDRERKRLQRLKNKSTPDPEQEAHKVAERVRVTNFRIKKKQAEQRLPCTTISSVSPFQTKQSTGKALKRVAKSLPNSPRKKRFVLAKMAKEAGLNVNGFESLCWFKC